MSFKCLVKWALVLLFLCSYIKLSSTSGGPCYITQWSPDGFGHQLEAKISCLLAEELTRGDNTVDEYIYVHTPFHKPEHEHSVEGSHIDQFINMENIIQHPKEITQKPRTPRYYSKTLISWWSTRLRGQACDPNVIYVVDNCWALVYDHPLVEKLYPINNTYLTNLRQAYHATPKPATGFNPNETNIVVHIRRTDGIVGTLEYFIEGIKFFSNYTFPIPRGRPKFWIETDDWEWEGLVKLKEIDPDNIYFTNTTVDPHTKREQLWTQFHRLVMADGIVSSYSSFSFAATYYSTAEKIVVGVNEIEDHNSRRLLFNHSRFQHIRYVPKRRRLTGSKDSFIMRYFKYLHHIF